MFNEPAVAEKFFGRQEVLGLLTRRVSDLREGYRQNIALTGQSLVGKSSIILHFIQMLKEEDFIPVYVEVLKEPFKSFSDKFIATLLYNSLIKIGEHVEIDIDMLYEKASKVFPRTYLSIKHINLCVDRNELDDAYSGLLALTSILKGEINKQFIVVLDEFDNLEHLGIKNPFLNFGKVIMVEKDTMYVVSSSRNEAVRKILSEKLSLLFGNFELVKISSFDPRTAVEFMRTRMPGFEIESDMEKFLIALTEGNPFYLDKITSCARRLAEERMTNYIDKSVIVDAMLDCIYRPNGVIYQYLLNFILELLDARYRERYLAMLFSIAKGLNKQSEMSRNLKVKKGEVQKALSALLELGLISKNGVFYKIDDGMLEFWLKDVFQKRRMSLVNGAIDAIRIFGLDATAYITAVVDELNRDNVSRLAELFNLFSNEMIQIYSKNVRLPHFTKVEVKKVGEGMSFIAASFRGKFWIVQAYDSEVNESHIIDYIRNVKAMGLKVANKVIIPLKGIDENAKLLGKELKISIWDRNIVNDLLRFYGRRRIIR
ncbi:MAG: hypothetical protein A2987_03050 [Omnitrophica bacterium RIFCSPLOWO2_01_FULL_45_10]|nr:MAG: hypothetical protein A2987_03050 [Omnitrophica bacterium RIFCSPLOWO2_01_FULL_45_10]